MENGQRILLALSIAMISLIASGCEGSSKLVQDPNNHYQTTTARELETKETISSEETARERQADTKAEAEKEFKRNQELTGKIETLKVEIATENVAMKERSEAIAQQLNMLHFPDVTIGMSFDDLSKKIVELNSGHPENVKITHKAETEEIQTYMYSIQVAKPYVTVIVTVRKGIVAGYSR